MSRPRRENRDWPLHTSQEMDALQRAASEGKYGFDGTFWEYNEQAGALVHDVPGIPHAVRLELTPEERAAGLTMDVLTDLARGVNADAALAILCIAETLIRRITNPTEDFPDGTIEFDDVAEMIGWTPRSRTERREMHRKIYHFILFGERALVAGRRKGRYIDKHSGEAIDTEVDAPLWRIHERERPVQGVLFPEADVPVAVELVISRTWAILLTSPQTAQYLPMGQVLGRIPGGQPSGAWARVMGLALASFWRRNPKEVLSGEIRPSRRELLDRYPPKTGRVHEVLAGNNPAWALNYWCGALKILAESGFIEATGEALATPASIKADLPRFSWGEVWLDQTVNIEPGPMMREALTSRITALAAVKPRRVGRPRKNEP